MNIYAVRGYARRDKRTLTQRAEHLRMCMQNVLLRRRIEAPIKAEKRAEAEAAATCAQDQTDPHWAAVERQTDHDPWMLFRVTSALFVSQCWHDGWLEWGRLHNRARAAVVYDRVLNGEVERMRKMGEA